MAEYRKPLDTILLFAAERDIQINEVTVSPSMYDELIAKVACSTRLYDSRGSSELKYKDTLVKKRKCLICCTHGRLDNAQL